jgi:hypothetical protein
MSQTRDQAIKNLQQCGQCKRWRTVPDCDHCWVDNHRCPPTVKQAIQTLNRAVSIGEEAKATLKVLRELQ